MCEWASLASVFNQDNTKTSCRVSQHFWHWFRVVLKACCVSASLTPTLHHNEGCVREPHWRPMRPQIGSLLSVSASSKFLGRRAPTRKWKKVTRTTCWWVQICRFLALSEWDEVNCNMDWFNAVHRKRRSRSKSASSRIRAQRERCVLLEYLAQCYRGQ